MKLPHDLFFLSIQPNRLKEDDKRALHQLAGQLLDVGERVRFAHVQPSLTHLVKGKVNMSGAEVDALWRRGLDPGDTLITPQAPGAAQVKKLERNGGVVAQWIMGPKEARASHPVSVKWGANHYLHRSLAGASPLVPPLESCLYNDTCGGKVESSDVPGLGSSDLLVLVDDGGAVDNSTLQAALDSRRAASGEEGPRLAIGVLESHLPRHERLALLGRAAILVSTWAPGPSWTIAEAAMLGVLPILVMDSGGIDRADLGFGALPRVSVRKRAVPETSVKLRAQH